MASSATNAICSGSNSGNVPRNINFGAIDKWDREVLQDIPNATYYLERSENLLNLAASIAFELYPNDYGYNHTKDDLEDYWLKCQSALSNVLTIIQQAQEFGLKGRICAVSPFLLLSREPRDWPKGCTQSDMSFSSFRATDATDLPKIHDTICNTRLTSDQRRMYEEIRSHRNMIMHYGTSRIIMISEIIDYLLSTFSWLHANKEWPESRSNYLANDQYATLYSSDHVAYVINREFDFIRDALTPARFKSLFGVTKKSRWYWCDRCRMSAFDNQIDNMTAKLTPNTPRSTKLVCLACGEDTNVTRKACPAEECVGNVFCDFNGDDLCMLCLAEWPNEAID